MERELHLKQVIAASLWTIAGVLTFVGTLTLIIGSTERLTLALYMHSVLTAVGAATVTVKNHIDRSYRLMGDAFEFGYELGCEGRTITPIRLSQPQTPQRVHQPQ